TPTKKPPEGNGAKTAVGAPRFDTPGPPPRAPPTRGRPPRWRPQPPFPGQDSVGRSWLYPLGQQQADQFDPAHCLHPMSRSHRTTSSQVAAKKTTSSVKKNKRLTAFPPASWGAA